MIKNLELWKICVFYTIYVKKVKIIQQGFILCKIT